jgi:hypothetical protein
MGRMSPHEIALVEMRRRAWGRESQGQRDTARQKAPAGAELSGSARSMVGNHRAFTQLRNWVYVAGRSQLPHSQSDAVRWQPTAVR